MRLKDRVSRRTIAEPISELVCQWCERHLGYGRKRYKPILFVERWNSTDYERGEYGYYSDGEIHVAYDKVKTVEELIRTIIHEWTHYIQPQKFLRYDEKTSYREQPCEQEAFRVEEAEYIRCWTSIKRKL